MRRAGGDTACRGAPILEANREIGEIGEIRWESRPLPCVCVCVLVCARALVRALSCVRALFCVCVRACVRGTDLSLMVEGLAEVARHGGAHAQLRGGGRARSDAAGRGAGRPGRRNPLQNPSRCRIRFGFPDHETAGCGCAECKRVFARATAGGRRGCAWRRRRGAAAAATAAGPPCAPAAPRKWRGSAPDAQPVSRDPETRKGKKGLGRARKNAQQSGVEAANLRERGLVAALQGALDPSEHLREEDEGQGMQPWACFILA